MKEVKKNIHCLHYLSQCKASDRRFILKNANKDLVYAICECFLNVLNGNVKLSDIVVKKIKRHKKTLRQLVNNSESIKNKKQLLVQKGGSILPLLLPTILEVVTNLIKTL